MLSIACGTKVSDDDLRALTQPERKRLGEIVKQLMAADKFLARPQAVQTAYYQVLAESVDFK